MSETKEKSTKRRYRRRSDEDRIAELEEKISSIRDRIEARKRRDSPVLREIPKVQRALRKFAQLALDHGREDLANSTTAFVAGLERAAGADVEEPKSGGRRARKTQD